MGLSRERLSLNQQGRNPYSRHRSTMTSTNSHVYKVPSPPLVFHPIILFCMAASTKNIQLPQISTLYLGQGFVSYKQLGKLVGVDSLPNSSRITPLPYSFCTTLGNLPRSLLEQYSQKCLSQRAKKLPTRLPRVSIWENVLKASVPRAGSSKIAMPSTTPLNGSAAR
ncbi:uncharacterized protein LY79DRAFT_559339 [Colletotrichum navitas]|uniref:Uncharacterized protein n=1 Tax=Colletotrichum navitas TaxID=681940 RepID=A0AAD8PW36_9PEZI|nr:uncharacterized protein LY79DRAFT_559339 [Colletotrichum navitas]KAK1585150.1 hypothetical protein LY79DRAFT_559339 [Colletotrichum navitas]